MSGLPITQFDLQQMDTIMCGLKFHHLSTQVVAIGEALVQLHYMLPQDPDFLLQDFSTLLACTEFVPLGGNDRLQLTHLLLCRASLSFQVRQSP